MDISTVGKLKNHISSYPHIPHRLTIRQAFEIMCTTTKVPDRQHRSFAMLVMDESNNLIGTLTLSEIIKGLEPRFLLPAPKAQGHIESDENLSIIWGSTLSDTSADLSGRPVHEVMIPVHCHVRSDDTITKAAHFMIHHNIIVMPVIDDGKITGIIGQTEVFEEIAQSILT